MTENVSRRKQKAIEALLTSATVGGAAKMAGVSERQMYRWLKEPEFKTLLDEAQATLMSSAGRRWLSLQMAAAEAVQDLMANAKSDAVKLNAAKLIADMGWRYHDNDIITRIEALEARLGGNHYDTQS